MRTYCLYMYLNVQQFVHVNVYLDEHTTMHKSMHVHVHLVEFTNQWN